MVKRSERPSYRFSWRVDAINIGRSFPRVSYCDGGDSPLDWSPVDRAGAVVSGGEVGFNILMLYILIE